MAKPADLALSARAKAIAEGLIRTDRAGKHGVYDQGMLRLERRGGGFYWIALDGSRLLRGARLPTADELQPRFIGAMKDAGILPRCTIGSVLPMLSTQTGNGESI